MSTNLEGASACHILLHPPFTTDIHTLLQAVTNQLAPSWIVNIIASLQVVDFFGFGLPDVKKEVMSMHHSHDEIHRLIPQVGDSMVTNLRRPIFTLLEDTGPGVHDTTVAACDQYLYQQQIGVVSILDRECMTPLCLPAIGICTSSRSVLVPAADRYLYQQQIGVVSKSSVTQFNEPCVPLSSRFGRSPHVNLLGALCVAVSMMCTVCAHANLGGLRLVLHLVATLKGCK